MGPSVGQVEMTMLTDEPTGTVTPADGLCATTTWPGETQFAVAKAVRTVNLAAMIREVAVDCDTPSTFGTVVNATVDTTVLASLCTWALATLGRRVAPTVASAPASNTVVVRALRPIRNVIPVRRNIHVPSRLPRCSRRHLLATDRSGIASMTNAILGNTLRQV
jgi:hypothetical protein